MPSVAASRPYSARTAGAQVPARRPGVSVPAPCCQATPAVPAGVWDVWDWQTSRRNPWQVLSASPTWSPGHLPGGRALVPTAWCGGPISAPASLQAHAGLAGGLALPCSPSAAKRGAWHSRLATQGPPFSACPLPVCPAACAAAQKCPHEFHHPRASAWSARCRGGSVGQWPRVPA